MQLQASQALSFEFTNDNGLARRTLCHACRLYIVRSRRWSASSTPLYVLSAFVEDGQAGSSSSMFQPVAVMALALTVSR
jgi:hypothetical protein